jgi:hypothetical protein
VLSIRIECHGFSRTGLDLRGPTLHLVVRCFRRVDIPFAVQAADQFERKRGALLDWES